MSDRKHPRLCCDCLWMSHPGEFARCSHPKTAPGPVERRTGFERQRFWTYCSTERGHALYPAVYPCGAEGALWEPAS